MYKCLLNSAHKIVSYPVPVTIEPLFSQRLPSLVVVTDQVRPGEVLLIKYDGKKVASLYKISDTDIHQINGSPEIDIENLEIECPFLNKKYQIEKYIFDIFDHLSLHDLTHNHHDLRHFENCLMSYLLKCKAPSKIDRKKIRSLCFKSFKDSVFAEKVDSLIKIDFEYFDNRAGFFNINFLYLRVEKSYK